MRYELQVESSRQYQTVFFYSQFNTYYKDDDLDVYESYSCSVSNQADAFSEAGPTEEVSVFVFNYHGTKMLKD